MNNLATFYYFYHFILNRIKQLTIKVKMINEYFSLHFFKDIYLKIEQQFYICLNEM